MSRYNRQIKLTEVGLEGQEKLRNAKVLLVGVGGLGCPAAMFLAGAGVGKMGLMDHDKVDMSNLHRQVLFQESDVGKSKGVVAKERLEKQNSEVQFEVDKAEMEELVQDFGKVEAAIAKVTHDGYSGRRIC